MAIGGIGQFDLFTDYQYMSSGRNALRLSENQAQADALNTQSKENEIEAVKPVAKTEEPLENISLRKNASLENISLDFSVDKELAMKGQDSDINSLDIQKAVSDMQKDQALMQYQYFVGDSQNIMNSDDGIVVRKF